MPSRFGPGVVPVTEQRGAETRVLITVDDGSDAAASEEVLRSLHAALAAHGIDGELGREAPPPGAKSVLGVLRDVAVPMASASVPVLAEALHGWITKRRDRCSITLKGPDGAEIQIPSVNRDELAEVLARWRAATESVGSPASSASSAAPPAGDDGVTTG